MTISNSYINAESTSCMEWCYSPTNKQVKNKDATLNLDPECTLDPQVQRIVH